MGLFRKNEERAETVQFDDALLKALFGSGTATKEMALQVPTVSGGIDLIAGMIAGTPVKLYRDRGGKAEEIRDDPRIRLLNDETGDTLNANEFWHAMVRDYYTGKGGYAYIRRVHGNIASLHYVDEAKISVCRNADPIFKDFDLLIGGSRYKPWDFFKILRNTKDGAEGKPVTKENSKLIETAYATLLFEKYMVRRGGNKKGFLKSEKRLDAESLNQLRSAFSRLYSGDSDGSDNFVLLNNGIDFKESSNTSVEMQLNENKQTNAVELAKIFHISPEIIAGKASEPDVSSLARLAAIPLMAVIQCAMNRDLLLEREKGEYYFAFDTKELLRGDMAQRFAAYKTALDANFMQIDEVRYAEDLEPLGLSWIKLGLQDVLYDPKTKEIFTPNTGAKQQLGEQVDSAAETRLQDENPGDTMEERGRYYKRDSKGRFAGTGVRMSRKEKERVSSDIFTNFPLLPAGSRQYSYENRNHFYRFSVNAPRNYSFHMKIKIEGNEDLIRQFRGGYPNAEDD